MLEKLKNAWRIEELRKKIIYTLGMLLLYRLLSVIPVPGMDLTKVSDAIKNFSILNFMSMMTGGSFERMTIMAMGITPYINSSIILQLLTVAIPSLEKLAKEGPEGRRKINEYTRYLTIILAFIQAVGLVVAMNAMAKSGFQWYLVIGICMAAGTALAMWIGERITENGIGNGISLLIMAGIVSNLFNWFAGMITGVAGGTVNIFGVLIVLAILLAMIVCVTYVDMGERRIPVQYARRVVGRKMYGGQSTHIPMKLLAVGVLPLIFAYSFMAFPGTIMAMVPALAKSGAYAWWQANMNQQSWLYALICALLIIGFSYFYSAISFNPEDISKNVQQQGGHIPGVRPGTATTMYLQRTSKRLTLFAALFLALLATLPTFLWRTVNVTVPFGASSILIAVQVALETLRQLEAQMTMRHYKGFL